MPSFCPTSRPGDRAGGAEPDAFRYNAGTTPGRPPGDAIVLFDGQNLNEWVSVNDKSPAQWTVADGVKIGRAHV